MAMKEIHTPPLDNHNELTSGELFRTLLEAGGWTYDQIADELGITVVKIDSVKGWGTRNVIPKHYTRDKLIEMIQKFCPDNKIANKWTEAFIQSWMRERIKKNTTEQIGKIICKTALHDNRLTKLPALFESDQRLPLATAYVELQLTPSIPVDNNPLLLETHLSLRQKLNKKIENRYTVRKSPKDLVDDSPLKTTLILGAPGAGKSSLLRRITLDIAEGKWELFKVPLFIEARAYWMARKSGMHTGLLTYAVNKMLPIDYDGEEALKLLLKQQKKQPFILLLDGLDEIASDSMAVNIIYEELKQLARSIPWVVTSRPSGLMASLGSVQRCEVIELDDESIEALTDNWCKSNQSQRMNLDAQHLKMEIFGSSGTREMARNPFLLTALCFLKSIKPNDDLPLSRIEVYETLLEQITVQAQRRHDGNKEILGPNVLDGLQDFVFSLYDHPDGVIQIFDRKHWCRFSKTHDDIGTEDFDLNILPSRLLSNRIGSETEFHFLHLSLQEHLIARAMLDRPLIDALERRFIPAWRAVFRFYGALLLQQGRENDFRHLTKTLYQEQDINRLSLLTLANIFADAGIRDTKDWIGEDLREELFLGAMSGFNAGPDAMTDALAILDPDWLEDAASAEIDDKIDLCKQLVTEGQDLIVSARLLSTSPFEKLARTRTSTARHIIANAFWGDDQNRALLATYAYAEIATPSERQQIVDKAASISMSENMALRVFAFAQAVHRAEFVPFLGKLLDHNSEKTNGPFSDALNLVADIGGKEASTILERLAKQEIGRLSDDFDAFEVVAKAVVRLGGRQAIQVLEQLESLPKEYSWKDSLQFLKFEADPSSEEAIITALNDGGYSYGETISALAGAANYGRIPNERITQVIRRHIDPDSINGIMDLSFIESARLETGATPILCDKLLEMAERHYRRIHDDEDENALDYLLTNLQLIFETLGQARWKPSEKLIHTILDDKYSNDHLLESATSLAGYVYSGTSDQTLLRHLKEIFFQEDCDYTYATAIAIGRIHLEELFRLQSAEAATEALEELAAEADLLIFDQFWVDRFGNKIKWQRPPKKVFYVCDDDQLQISEIFSHELSRYGFCFEDCAPEKCVAYLVFDENQGYWADVAQNLSGSGCPLIKIPKKLTTEAAIKMAREIGVEFLSNYGQMQPPSLPIHF